jgi:hypothetical protein
MHRQQWDFFDSLKSRSYSHWTDKTTLREECSRGYKKRGHTYQKSACGNRDKNGECFVVGWKEWAQIQEQCLWEEREGW